MDKNMVDRRRLVGMSEAAAALPIFGDARQATPGASPAAVDIQLEGTVDENGYYPSNNPAVPDAYTKPPAELEKSYDGTPGSGGRVSCVIMTYNPPPTQRQDNPWWQELETRLNVEWEPLITPHANYGEKVTTLIASGDMPDLFYLNPGQTDAPLMSFVDQGAFLDLTEYVTGDALQDYPNLARYADFRWQAATMNGQIFGIPNPQRKTPQLPFYRDDWATAIIGGAPGNAQEVRDMLVGMSKDDPDGNGSDDTWGMAIYDGYWSLGLLQQMFRVPHNWRVDDSGAFTHMYETDEMREYLEYARQLYVDGAYHPDGAAMSYNEGQNLFTSGRAGLFVDGWKLYGPDGHLATIRTYDPDATAAYLLPPGKDGGTGVGYNQTGLFGFTCIPSTVTDPERVRELLRILDYLSAPYGTEEHNFLMHGIEGVHYEVNENGFPVVNDRYMQDWGQLTSYLAGPEPVHIDPATPLLGPFMTDLDNKAYSIGIDDPSANLFSPTEVSDSSGVGQGITDAIADFITGRGEMADFDSAVERWRTTVGDTIRGEYETAYAANS